MVQVRYKVGTAMKGSMKAVAGSGMASMSLASMLFQPRMEEPSNPSPSLKVSSLISLIGRLKCCQVPKVSTNFTSTILAPSFLAISNTLLGVLICDDSQGYARVWARGWGKAARVPDRRGACQGNRRTRKETAAGPHE